MKVLHVRSDLRCCHAMEVLHGYCLCRAGQPVNRAARLMSAASGGQTLCEQQFMLKVLQDWNKRTKQVRSWGS